GEYKWLTFLLTLQILGARHALGIRVFFGYHAWGVLPRTRGAPFLPRRPRSDLPRLIRAFPASTLAKRLYYSSVAGWSCRGRLRSAFLMVTILLRYALF